MTDKKRVSKKKKAKKPSSDKSSSKKIPEIAEEKKEDVKPEDQKRYSKMTKWFLVFGVLVLVLIIAGYFVIQAQRYSTYKGIEFQTTKVGQGENIILFYETLTLLPSNDGTNQSFGFRMRTKPSKLKDIPFEGVDNFELRVLNGYSYEEGHNFSCNGYGVVAMENLKRLFQKTGGRFLYDPNATCDDKGRYNYFYFTYGNETEIKEIGQDCYEVVIKGNDNECEILPATEKLMVEMYAKYNDLVNN